MEMTNETYTMNEMYRLGMECLVERFGIVNTELFITAVKTENSNYTEWRHNLFDDMTVEEFDAAVMEFAKSQSKSQ